MHKCLWKPPSSHASSPRSSTSDAWKHWTLIITRFVCVHFVWRGRLLFQTTYIYLVFFSVCYLFYELDYKRRRLPKGPTPWLIVGNVISFAQGKLKNRNDVIKENVFLAKNVDDLFQFWKREFGGIFTVWIGPIPLVMVSHQMKHSPKSTYSGVRSAYNQKVLHPTRRRVLQPLAELRDRFDHGWVAKEVVRFFTPSPRPPTRTD